MTDNKEENCNAFFNICPKQFLIFYLVHSDSMFSVKLNFIPKFCSSSCPLNILFLLLLLQKSRSLAPGPSFPQSLDGTALISILETDTQSLVLIGSTENELGPCSLKKLKSYRKASILCFHSDALHSVTLRSVK